MSAAELESAEVQRRLSMWRRTGDVHALWPDISYAMRRRAMDQLRGSVSAMLGTSGSAPVLDAVDEREVRALGVAAFTAGLGPLVAWWVARGGIDASGPVRDMLERHARHGSLRSALLRMQAARMVAAMREAGASPIVLKGLHTGAEFFPDPATRPASDIDILVRPDDRSRAVAALRGLGFVESRRTAYGARSEWSLVGSSSEVRSLDLDHVDNPWSVDLHTCLERWYFRGMRKTLGDGPFDTRRSIVIEGQSALVLDQPYLTTFLALHAGYELGRIQLVRLLDVVLASRMDMQAGRLDWNEVSELLDRTGTTRFVYPALALATEVAPGFVPSDRLERMAHGSSARMRRALDAVRQASLGPLQERTLDVKLAWAVGAKETLMNLFDIVLPADDGDGSLRHVYGRRLAALGRRIAPPRRASASE